MENMTQEQKVLAAAGPQNVKQSTAATNAKVAAAAPAPRPTAAPSVIKQG